MDKELLELMLKIYAEMDKGFNSINKDIDILKKDLSNNPNKLEKLNSKLTSLIKVQKKFKLQLDELQDKINILIEKNSNL